MLQIFYKYSMGLFNTIYFVGVDIVKTVCQVQSLLLPGCYSPYWSGNSRFPLDRYMACEMTKKHPGKRLL